MTNRPKWISRCSFFRFCLASTFCLSAETYEKIISNRYFSNSVWSNLPRIAWYKLPFIPISLTYVGEVQSKPMKAVIWAEILWAEKYFAGIGTRTCDLLKLFLGTISVAWLRIFIALHLLIWASHKHQLQVELQISGLAMCHQLRKFVSTWIRSYRKISEENYSGFCYFINFVGTFQGKRFGVAK